MAKKQKKEDAAPKPKVVPPIEAPQLRYMRIDAVHAADINPKRHRLEDIKSSVRRFGMVSPAVMNEATGKLVVGHGRVTATKALMDAQEPMPSRVTADEDGMWMVPILVVNFANDDEARAYLIADNRMTELGGWDTNELLAELHYLDSIDAAVGIGWSVEELAKLLSHNDQAEAGKPAITSGEETKRFLEASVKPLFFHFIGDQYDQVVDALEKVAEDAQLTNHSEVLIMLLRNYCRDAGISVVIMPDAEAAGGEEAKSDGDSADRSEEA